MYYVLFVGTGNESLAEDMIRKYGSEYCPYSFHPVAKYRKKIRGSWTDVYKRLIPGYVFVKTEDVNALYKALRDAHVFHHILNTEKSEEGIDFYPLAEEEVYWLKQIMGAPKEMSEVKPVIGLSQIDFNENDQIVIKSGPLKNMEGQIKKIALHRRQAQVEVKLMKRTITLYLGVEILEKPVE